MRPPAVSAGGLFACPVGDQVGVVGGAAGAGVGGGFALGDCIAQLNVLSLCLLTL